MVAYILCCCFWMILKDSFDKSYWSIPFKIKSPIVPIAFLFAIFLYSWLWSKFFSYCVLSQISLFSFSFIRFGFTSLLEWWSCEIINEFPSREAWSVLFFYISMLVQLSVAFVGFNLYLISLVLIFGFNLYLPAPALNSCLSVLCFTVKIFY